MNEDSEYHLRELAVARSADDPRRVMPEIPDGARRVLDIGCGAGQTLVASDLKGAGAFGIDYDFSALQMGKSLGANVSLVQATGERLPFADRSFDFVFSRVALPYMRIPPALREIARVLVPGGRIWLSLHSLKMASWSHALSNPRRTAYEIYKLLNTAALHFGSSQYRYPLAKRRTESYQTTAGIRRALTRAGFTEIEIRRGAFFIVSAKKGE